MASNIIGNRNSTPEASSSKSSLHPPSSSRNVGGNHQLRSSADMSAFSQSSMAARNIRPASEVLFNPQSQQHNGQDDSSNKLGEQWIHDIEQYETMLEEMAAATLDQDFKDELSAIEQWFRVLSEAERTAATYALIQQTTQMQQRFFAQVLNQMSRSHPISGVLSPSSFGEKDAMSNRLSDAMSKLTTDSSRAASGRPPPPSPSNNKRNSGLDPSTISAMFPDAAAAIAQKKAEYAQQAATASSNRNSLAPGDRASLAAPTISAPPAETGKDSLPSHLTSTSWRASDPQPPIGRPKSSSGQPTPMGQFAQPPPSAGLRSPRPPQSAGLAGAGAGPASATNIQNTTLNAPDSARPELPALSPYNLGNSSWASMSNTPMVPSFNTQQQNIQNDMIANATAMKLAALSTVTNRIALDDVRKYRRSRSNEPQPHAQAGMAGASINTGIPGANMVVVNEQGQVVNPQQLATLQQQQQQLQQQQQQLVGQVGNRSRPNSPGRAMQGSGLGQVPFAAAQNNGFLTAYDGNSPMMNPAMGSMVGSLGSGTHEGYLSDHSEMQRGRSPRGRRGSSKPPEDPTDPHLLQDIPTWLRSLRLHKYTDNLKDLKWDELVQLDEKGLEARGVNAQGARNKMLKVFEQVREAKASGKL